MPDHEQQSLKKAALIEALRKNNIKASAIPTIKWVDIGRSGTRDRVDFVFKRTNLQASSFGLYNRTRTGVTDLQGCPQMSGALESWLHDFRRKPVPIQLGSIRLRVSASGKQRGVWLDLANVDIKKLLDEQSYLNWLFDQSIVEMGQRRKRVVRDNERLRLGDPVLEPWFETYINDGATAVPLYCSIGAFTQPGTKGNRALVATVTNYLKAVSAETPLHTAIEFGSGIGNFTLPLAAQSQTVIVYESDRLALAGLDRSLTEAGLKSRVQRVDGDAQRSREQPWVDFARAAVAVVDPPRSGLRGFLDHLTSDQLTPFFISISCFAETFAHDTAAMIRAGYEIQDLTIVDQFPETPHFEVVALLRAPFAHCNS